MAESTHDSVKEYYGQFLKTNDDLQTSACCIAEAVPNHLKAPISKIHDDVAAKFYGCGSPIPHKLEGCTVLDLGCGSGRDVYLLSQLVGEKGRVIGIDMTEEQLSVAKKYQEYHADKFGFAKSNVELHLGYIEDLKAAGIADNSVDVVVSNCVINLSPAKEKVFSEIFRVLKPGGELYFSDVFSDRRIPENLAKDPVVLGECLGGAMYIEDFRRMIAALGCADFRIVSNSNLEVTNPAIAAKTGNIHFYSTTISAFKLELEDLCENFGHVAFYKGDIDDCPNGFALDEEHYFEKGLPVPVCGNTAKMLSETRFRKHFNLVGNFDTHYGVFGYVPAEESEEKPDSSGSCC